MSFPPTCSEAERYLGGRATLWRFPVFRDQRGCLCPHPFHHMPFMPQRSFVVSQVPAGTVRGGHAHRTARQLLFCVAGRIDVLMRAGGEEAGVVLADGACGLLLEAGVWAQQTYAAEHSVLLVYASEPFDPGGYVTPAGRV